MDKGQELKVCIYFYKKQLGYRADINVSDKELSDEIIFIEGVRNQKYFYEYCGTNMFVKKTEDEKFLILINNTLQTPKNWFDNKENLIELTKESLNDLFELLSET